MDVGYSVESFLSRFESMPDIALLIIASDAGVSEVGPAAGSYL